MNEAELVARLTAEGLNPSSWSNRPGDVYAAHAHAFDKVLVCVNGTIEFSLRHGRIVRLVPGDRLDLPAGTDHDARVGPGGVTCLEAHLPAGTLGAGPARRPAGDW
ncbi:MAG: cupin [Chloroflexi bacterium]|nr:cupin [Chloroflexota bacterium]